MTIRMVVQTAMHYMIVYHNKSLVEIMKVDNLLIQGYDYIK